MMFLFGTALAIMTVGLCRAGPQMRMKPETKKKKRAQRVAN